MRLCVWASLCLYVCVCLCTWVSVCLCVCVRVCFCRSWSLASYRFFCHRPCTPPQSLSNAAAKKIRPHNQLSGVEFNNNFKPSYCNHLAALISMKTIRTESSKTTNFKSATKQHVFSKYMEPTWHRRNRHVQNVRNDLQTIASSANNHSTLIAGHHRHTQCHLQRPDLEASESRFLPN